MWYNTATMQEGTARPNDTSIDKERTVRGREVKRRRTDEEKREQKTAQQKEERERKAKEKESAKREKSERDLQKKLEEAKRKIEAAKKDGTQKKIPADLAKDPINVVDGLQNEGNGGKVAVTTDDLEKFKKLLIDYGHFNASRVTKMQPEQVMVAAQMVLQNVDVVDSGRATTLEEGLALAILQKVRNPAEETLTAEKVGEYLEVLTSEEYQEKYGRVSAPKPHAAPVQEVKPRPDVVVEQIDGKPLYVIPTYPHLMNTSGAQVAEIFEDREIPVAVPEGWDKWNPVERDRWLSANGVMNVTEVPPLDGSEKELGSIQKLSDGSYEMGRLPDLLYQKSQLSWMLEKAGVDLVLPKDWDKRATDQKIAYLEKNGLHTYDSADEFFSLTDWKDNTPTVPPRPYPFRPGVARNEEVGAEEALERYLDIGEARRTDPNFGTSGLAAEEPLLEARVRGLITPDGAINKLIIFSLGPLGPREIDARNLLADYLTKYKDNVIRLAGGNEGFRQVNSLANIIQAYEGLYPPGTLNPFISAADRALIIAERHRMNLHFRGIYDGSATKDEAHIFLRALDSQIRSYRTSLGNYIADPAQIEGHVEPTIRQTSALEKPAFKGITEWLAGTVIAQMKEQLNTDQRRDTPNQWQESMVHVRNNLRLGESLDYSVEEMSQGLQRILRIAEAIQVETITGDDPLEAEANRTRARELRAKIVEIHEAAKQFLIYRTTVRNTNMDPEKVGQMFANTEWKDSTWRTIFEMFNVDDDEVYFSTNAVPPDPLHPELDPGRFNLLDKAKNLIDKRINREKIKMNMIEELTLYDDISQSITVNGGLTAEGSRFLNDVARRWERTTPWTAGQIADFESLRANFERRLADINASALPQDQLTWGNVGHMKNLIDKWFQEETLLGAWGLDQREFLPSPPNPVGTRNPNYKRDFVEFRRGELLGELKTLLGGYSFDPARVDKYEKTGLLQQVTNNAYHITWSWGAFSDNGAIRIFDKTKPWFKHKGVQYYQFRDMAYSQDSKLFNGRMIDTFSEFLIHENRGRAGKGRDKPNDANYVFLQEMIGRRRGLMHHNRLSVKVVSDIFRLRGTEQMKDSLVDGTTRGRLDELVRSTSKKLHNIDKFRFKDDGDFLDKNEKGWAEGVAIAELIEDGEISFERVEWSKIFESDATMKEFNMGDWWGDRTGLHKYVGSGAIQTYLQHPSAELFYDLNSIEKFYSKREIRLKPYHKIVTPAAFALGRYWKKFWHLDYNMPTAEKEAHIQQLVALNKIEEDDEDWMKEKYLGWGKLPGNWLVRNAREANEMAMIIGKETGKMARFTLPFLFLWALIKGIFSQSQAQLAGK